MTSPERTAPAGRVALAGAAAVVLGAVFGLHRIVDPDLFEQVAVGRATLAHPLSLGVSWFHFTYPGFAYVADKWLSSVLAALFAAAGGENGLMVYQVLLPAFFAGALFFALRRWGAAWWAALAATALGLAACGFRVEPRPETLSLALLAVLLGLLRGDIPFRVRLVATAALMALWVNLHGFFFVGLLTLVAAVVAAAVDERREFTRALAVAGAGAAACFLHPQGWRAVLWPIQQLLILHNQPVLRESIQELFPTRELFVDLGVARWALLAATAAAALLVDRRARSHTALRVIVGIAAAAPWLVAPPPGLAQWPYRASFALWLAALIEAPAAWRARRALALLFYALGSALAWSAGRNVPFAAIASLFLLAPAWTGAAADAARASSATATRRVERLLAAAAIVLVVAGAWARLGGWLAPGTYRTPGWTGWGYDRESLPVEAAEFVARERLAGPLLNDFQSGGYLLFRLHPERSVFIAGNTSFYPPEFLETYRREVMGGAEDAAALHTRFGVRTVVLSHAAMETPGLIARLVRNPAWKLAHVDPAAAVFAYQDDAERAAPAADLDAFAASVAATTRERSSGARRLGVRRAIFPALNIGVFLRAAGRPDLALKLADAWWDAGPAEKLATFAAAAAEESGRLPGQVDRLEMAARWFPASQPVRSWLSRALFTRATVQIAHGEHAAARPDLERCLALSPDEAGPKAALAHVLAAEGRREQAQKLLAEALARDDGRVREWVRNDPLLRALLDPGQ